MTVREYMEKFNRDMTSTRVYVEELEDEIWRAYEMEQYLDDEVIDVWDHNGDMVCKVKEAR